MEFISKEGKRIKIMNENGRYTMFVDGKVFFEHEEILQLMEEIKKLVK